MYNVILHKDASTFYKKADAKLRERINTAVETILQNPGFNAHVKKLQGKLSKMYRYRLGDIRILYEIHEDIKTVRIKTIEYRGRAYK